MTSPSRREVFANFLANYHNSFAGRNGDLVEHSPLFIRKVVESSAAPFLAASTLKLDPKLTSTDQGAVAYSIAKAVSEDKQIAPSFLDIELADKTLMVYFEASAPIDKVEKRLAETGKVGIVARPGMLISDGIESDLFILAVEPSEKVSEAVVVEMKKKMPAFLKKKGDKGKDKKDDSKDCSGDGQEESAPAADGSYTPVDEVTHYGLAEDVFGDEGLAACTADAGAVRAVFASLYGEKATVAALSAKISESSAPLADDLNGQRNRLLRIMAGRGVLPHGAEITWPAPVAEAISKAIAGLVAGDKWQLVEGKGRTATASEVFEAARDEIAIAIDAVTEDIEEVYESFVDRVVDLGLTAPNEEKRAALVARVAEAAEKNDKVGVRCLAALARVAMFESGLHPDAASGDMCAAWDAYVLEATKAPPVPATVADDILSDLLGLGA